ncbi:DUF4118 domain-containing protein [Candidatus Magnetaquicoccus inordinatus]|uniref:DUF4118 domain-containing protein n=1 Tax=Candidatus Magnetaquicoccus inordinatus TaxID=2496818 RepID=UPI00102B7D9E|nr:DUF4118 domain-containing protein [Candidatus Magnetaquicoccus inordinatus]
MNDPAPASQWQLREAVLVCIGPGPDSERLIERAARRASQTGAPWHAIAIETPASQWLPEPVRSRIQQTLATARQLGAQTANPYGRDAVSVAIAYARQHHLGTLLVGRDRYRRLPWQHGFAERIARQAPDLELLQLARSTESSLTLLSRMIPHWQAHNNRWLAYAMALIVVAIVTGSIAPFYEHLDLANLVMIFLLAVLLTAIRFGRGAAMLAAFLSVASFDYFFVPPRFTFAVHDTQHLVTFAIMLTVALVVGQLTASLQWQALVANQRETHMRALYEMARQLTSAMNVQQMLAICQQFMQQGCKAAITLLLPDAQERLQPVTPHSTTLLATHYETAQRCFALGEQSGWDMDTLSASHLLFLPLKAPTRICGVLVVQTEEPLRQFSLEQKQLLETSTSLLAISLERLHYVELSQQTQLTMSAERLRNSLLSAISHDLRTPMTIITGLSEALCLAKPSLQEPHVGLAKAIREEAARTVTMANNLLDMARMQMGNFTLNRHWQTLEEVIGVSMGDCATILARHRVSIDLPVDLPLLQLDSVLMERVFNNLLENGAKHTPPGTLLHLSAHHADNQIIILFCDDGPGLPSGMEEKIFDKFTRGKTEASSAGFGLGLAIVRTIIEAHGGTVSAKNRPDGGACFTIRLPAGEPPTIPEEQE